MSGQTLTSPQANNPIIQPSKFLIKIIIAKLADVLLLNYSGFSGESVEREMQTLPVLVRLIIPAFKVSN